MKSNKGKSQPQELCPADCVNIEFVTPWFTKGVMQQIQFINKMKKKKRKGLENYQASLLSVLQKQA